MKLKFRVTPKDMTAFVVFSILLLYLIAIAILNISSLSTNNTFHGFNPLPAFIGEKLPVTMTLFLIALIAIIFGVSSSIFNREKGVGFEIKDKADKGYSRWLKEKEMKKELKMVRPGDETSEYGGIPLINNGKEIWVDNSEYHNLIIGSTGSGKTEMLVQPMVKCLAKSNQSMIITDPKGEIYERNANELRERGYKIVLLNFRDPQKGNCWNPLSLPYSLYKSGNSDKANELLDDLAMNILYDESSQNQDPFWEKTSADYFAGLSLALFDDADESQINLNSINLMTTAGEEKFRNTTYMKEYFSYKDEASPAYVNVSSTLLAPQDTKGSILSVFKQKIKLFSSRENLSEMLSHSDFDMKDIGREKTAVFIVVQDEKKTYHSLVTIFIKQVYETLIDVAQEAGGKLPFRTNFILDEFANMPPLKDVTTMVTAARSRAIRFSFIIQNFAQLNQVYGKENAETIKGNCGNIIYLISSELTALEEISKMCGEEKSKEKDKTASTPLVTVSDLQRLPQWSTVVLRIRKMPFKTKMTPNWKLEKEGAWGKSYPKAEYPLREKEPLKLFDIKEFVTKKNEEKFKNGDTNSMMPPGMFGGFGGPGMFGGGMPSMFGGGAPSPIPSSGPSEDSSFDVDDLIKKIDAKIAELEAEEKNESKDSNLDVKNDITDLDLHDDINSNSSLIDSENLDSDIISGIKEEVSTVNNDLSNKKVIDYDDDFDTLDDDFIEIDDKKDNVQTIKSNDDIEILPDDDVVTDDQFFDDFFTDDDE